MHESETLWLIERARESDSFAEIGCWHGITTRNIATNSTTTIYAIDHFQGSEELQGILEEHEEGWQHSEFLKNVNGLLNVKVLPLSSVDASKSFADNSLGVVFIDAAHDYESVKRDIEAWAPKVKVGGYLCGHDYGSEIKNGNRLRQVAEAVDELLPSRRIAPKTSIWYVQRGSWKT